MTEVEVHEEAYRREDLHSERRSVLGVEVVSAINELNAAPFQRSKVPVL